MTTTGQTMWSYQRIFRRILEMATEESLGSIGVTAAPKAILVGVEEGVIDAAVTVEPSDAGISQQKLAEALASAKTVYEGQERRQLRTDRAAGTAKIQNSVLDVCRAEALASTLSSQTGFESRRWFVGHSSQVGKNRVYPMIGVLRTRWEALPALSRHRSERLLEMSMSIQEAVVKEVLKAASISLKSWDEAPSLSLDDRGEIVRRATRRFIGELVYFNGDFTGGDFTLAMNQVAAQPYEGRTGVGTMLLAGKSDYILDLSFESPIPLDQTRALRKALEMTGSNLHLVTDGSVILGLGRLSEAYEAESETAFWIQVSGRGSWELEHAGLKLLTVTDAQASVPKQRLDRSRFDDAVERLFGGEGAADQLWDLAMAASDQAHGTMLVVHKNAREEAHRLSPPALDVEPQPLTPEVLLAVSSIDGAILVDPLGQCHSVGVILDGLAAKGLGDASRGARFNSAHRYLAGTERDCLIIIVSEDGMLNLIPDLPRRVRRSYVEGVLLQVEFLSKKDPVNFESFFKSEEHLRSVAFYLTAEQCSRANAALDRVEDFREKSAETQGGFGAITRVFHEKYVPHPDLDDSFFWDEKEQ